MTDLDYAAWSVLIFLAILCIAVVVFVGSWPGRIAKKRNHSYAEAITIGGWVTLIVGVIIWPVSLLRVFLSDTIHEQI